MKQNKDKPIAWFDEVVFTERELIKPSWIEEYLAANADTYRVATCTAVQHPVLGYEPIVYTSVVIAGDETEFETLNTVYKKRKVEK